MAKCERFLIVLHGKPTLRTSRWRSANEKNEMTGLILNLQKTLTSFTRENSWGDYFDCVQDDCGEAIAAKFHSHIAI